MQPRIDDGSISDGELLWRRVNSAWWDPDKGCLKSLTFRDGYTGEVSVHRACLTSREVIFTQYPEILGLASIAAGTVRLVGCLVVPDPMPDDPSHALICFPSNMGSSKIKRLAKKIAIEAKYIPSGY